MTFDYETLRLIWWLFLGVLLIGFAVTDGFDLGVCMLLPIVGKTDVERRVLINSVGPTWEGNQIWLVTAGGALFAAWPLAYAVAFSGLYFALLLTLFALFLRPIGFDYRSKLPDPIWRACWDWSLFTGALVPSLIFGVAFGNLLQGLPFYFDEDMRIFYIGSFWGLLNPFALLAGIVSLAMLVMHGAVYLQMRSTDVIQQRCKPVVLLSAVTALACLALAGIWVAQIDGYQITSAIDPNAASNPLAKTVAKAPGLWLDNYRNAPLLWMIPVLAFIAGTATIMLSKLERPGLAFISSSVTLAAIILTAGVAMFPFLLPSSAALASSLTVWDASSSFFTLRTMFWVTLFFLPIVLLYTSWVYRVLRGKITPEHIRNNDHSVY